MAIQMRLGKDDNVLYTEFPTAYWVIENISFHNSNGEGVMKFHFNTYPSREAKMMTNQPFSNVFPYGGAVGICYQPILHTFEMTIRTAEVFPNGIPITEREQKDELYSLIKAYMNLTDYEDIYE